jgi:hypothetical protein
VSSVRWACLSEDVAWGCYGFDIAAGQVSIGLLQLDEGCMRTLLYGMKTLSASDPVSSHLKLD